MQDTHGALLPNGMVDGLPERAESESRVSAVALNLLARFGYRQVNPPLVEFEESLLAENGGQALSKNTFRMMDPISRRMMAIRSDVTIQIVRLAASRLKSTPRPLRLSYVADALRVQGTQLRPERQFRQIGCEVLGSDSLDESTESAFLAVHALHEIGVPHISIDFAAPEIVRFLASKSKDSEKFAHAAQLRDEAALKKFGDQGKLLIALHRATGEADQFFKAVSKITAPPPIRKSISRLKAVVAGLTEALKAYDLSGAVTITIDPLETKGFEYQTSPSFTLFARGVRGELGRGGFYEASFQLQGTKSHNEPANGFTLYVDTILRAIGSLEQVQRISVPSKTSWNEVRMLQTEGFSVVKESSADCTYVYKDGKISKVRK